jgi:ABC-type nitrate/sulfonate/bicarbonate transport system permease component
MRETNLTKYLLGAMSCVTILTAWQAVSQFKVVNPVLLPPPTKVLPVIWELFRTGAAFEPLAQTFELLFGAYALGCALAIVLGLLMGVNRHIFNLLEPTLELLRPIPMVALIPPLFLFIGMGTTTEMVVVTMATFFPVLINTIQGVRGVDPIVVDMARTFGQSRFATMRKVTIWAALPMILTGMRIGLGYALILAILAEMLIDSRGVGFLILDMQRSFATTTMLAWILILGIVGVALNAIFEQFERAAVPWKSK